MTPGYGWSFFHKPYGRNNRHYPPAIKDQNQPSSGLPPPTPIGNTGPTTFLGGKHMQPESKSSAELIERYEKNFGAAGRRRGMIIMGVAVIMILAIIIGFTRSMSYLGGLNAHVYDVFDAKDTSAKKD
jgi:hypothetical protein